MSKCALFVILTSVLAIHGVTAHAQSTDAAAGDANP
jgi:hypothetical protein